ncbi:solute carrier family 22 member 15-like [Elysia marginata]|uniref:Solute carrier family 22 member 15-like n=1 Tax=Elysia marginata TaxID=1093978 RepID=A0AAV4FUB0_9GAST|nr:solute carrier family 22 member 15-like [Elysia marginata]
METKGVDGPTSLDDVIQEVGACGPFQGLLLLLVHSTILALVGGMMMMAFGSYNPGWECLDVVPMDDNLTTVSNSGSQLLNQSYPDNITDRCVLHSKCTNVSFSSESSTVATEWGLVCEHAWALKVILTVQMVGVLLGAYIVGHIGDYFGRKAGLYIMVGLHGVSNLIATFSPSWQVFAAIRFFIGVAAGGIISPAYVFPPEFTNQFWRGVINAIPTWSISASLLSLFVMLLKDWRQLHLLYAVLSCLVLLPIFWVPESFRWLAVHGQDKKATDVAMRIARLNKRPQPSLELLVDVAESERRRASAERSQRYTYFDLFKNTFLRKPTSVLSFVWLSLSVGYFGISFNVQALSGNFYINFMILSVLEVPGIIFSLPTNSFAPRRFGAGINLVIVSIACFGITITSLSMDSTVGNDTTNNNTVRASIILALAVVAKLGILCAWNVITVYSLELYPTVVRNQGFSFLNAAARMGSLVGPVLFPQDPAHFYLAMIVLGMMTLISAGLLLLLQETKGSPMEDMFRSISPPNVDSISGGNALIASQGGTEV